MPTWPTTLPIYPDDSAFTETSQKVTISSQPEIGPAKVRRRVTVAPRKLTASYTMTDAEIAIFRTFYIDTLLGGQEVFEWPHPRLDRSVTAYFTKIPTYKNKAYNQYSLDIEISVDESKLDGWFVAGWFDDWF